MGTDSSSRDAAQALTTRDALDTMQASNGYICFVYRAQGSQIFLRYNADEEWFERVRVYTPPSFADPDDTPPDQRVRDYWCATPDQLRPYLIERIDADGETTFSDFYDPVAYPDTPFPVLSDDPDAFDST